MPIAALFVPTPGWGWGGGCSITASTFLSLWTPVRGGVQVYSESVRPAYCQTPRLRTQPLKTVPTPVPSPDRL